jgi:four helix bundle protein
MRGKKETGNPILNKTLSLSVLIVKFCDQLNNDNKREIAKQLLRSGTSIGANIREAQNPESNADFVHKFKIAAKEIKETEYWLDIIEECYTKYDINKISELLDEVAKITNSIISTMKNKTKINHLHIRLTYYPLVLGRGRH